MALCAVSSIYFCCYFKNVKISLFYLFLVLEIVVSVSHESTVDNVAHLKEITSVFPSNVPDSSRLVDNNTGTCLNSSIPERINIDLLKVYQINRLSLTVQPNAYFRDIYVFISNTSFSTSTPCAYIIGLPSKHNTHNIFCNNNAMTSIWGRHLVIIFLRNRDGGLCELSVYVCRDFFHGPLCDKPCNCGNASEICDKETGYCFSGKSTTTPSQQSDFTTRTFPKNTTAKSSSPFSRTRSTITLTTHSTSKGKPRSTSVTTSQQCAVCQSSSGNLPGYGVALVTILVSALTGVAGFYLGLKYLQRKLQLSKQLTDITMQDDDYYHMGQVSIPKPTLSRNVNDNKREKIISTNTNNNKNEKIYYNTVSDGMLTNSHTYYNHPENNISSYSANNGKPYEGVQFAKDKDNYVAFPVPYEELNLAEEKTSKTMYENRQY